MIQICDYKLQYLHRIKDICDSQSASVYYNLCIENRFPQIKGSYGPEILNDI